MGMGGHVVRAPARREARALHEVGPGEQGPDVVGDVDRVHRAVGVEHDDDVAGGGREPGAQGRALAAPLLAHHPDTGPKGTGHVGGAVGRGAVDQDQLVDPGGDPGQDVGRFSASFMAGITTLTVGAAGRSD